MKTRLNIKGKIKNWLGISDLENLVGQPKKESRTSTFYSLINDLWGSWTPVDASLYGKFQRLRDDFEELDKKYDALERYLQIEFVKEKIEKQTYDWADKKETVEYRKTKSFAEIKKEKTAAKDEDDD